MGQSISELQVESQTRIKISQSSDYYPGTQDRVCLIQATSMSHVKHAVRLIIQRCYHIQQTERSQQQQSQLGAMTTFGGTMMQAAVSSFSASVPVTDGQVGSMPVGGMGGDGFDFIIRLLVPVTCCGMIIGKSGSNIKYMEESCGVVSVRLTSKDDIVPQVTYNNSGGMTTTGYTTVMIPTNERIITITSMTVEQCVQCIYMVLDSMMAHPDISQYVNMTTSYVQHNHHHNQQQQQQQHRHQLPQAAAYNHNPMMLHPSPPPPPQPQQPFVRRRVYHVPPSPALPHSGVAPDPQPPQMYWSATGGGSNGMYHTVHQQKYQQLNQSGANLGMNRRIASSPNFSMVGGQHHHDGSRRETNTALANASTTQQQAYNNVALSSTFSQSEPSNPSHTQQHLYTTT
jgi:KH domain